MWRTVKIVDNEKPTLKEVLDYLDNLTKTTSELKTTGEIILKGAPKMRADTTQILKILTDEYGITNERELDEAIRKQGFINVAPFCTSSGEGGRKKQYRKKGKMDGKAAAGQMASSSLDGYSSSSGYGDRHSHWICKVEQRDQELSQQR